MPESTGPITDPENRRRRAKVARAAQSTVDYHIRKLVDEAPPLTAAQRDKLAAVLRPTQAAPPKEAA